MSTRFDKMAAQRDPLYAATRSRTPFLQAITADREAVECRQIGGLSGIVTIKERERDGWLHRLTVRALRNQREPYYSEAQP